MTEVQKGAGWLPVLVYPVVSAAILAAAFPPLPLGLLACVGLLPLFLSAERLKGRQAFGAGFLQGVVFHAATLYWIAWITPPGMAGAILYLSLFRGLFVWALSLVVRRLGAVGLWSAPFLWLGIEYLASLGDMGFPWLVLGYTQAGYLMLIQYAQITGVYGVSFWVVWVNLALLMLLRGRARWRMPAVALVLLFGLPAVYGFLRLAEVPKEGSVAVGVVQPDMPPVAKENWGFEYNFNVLKPLTLQAARQGARLVVWPEAAVPAYFQHGLHRSYRERVQALVDSLDVYLYTGANHMVRDSTSTRMYNSSFFFSPGKRSLQRYDKIKLVPFGERAPFPELVPFLRKIRWSGGGFVSADFDSGKERMVFQGPGVRFSGMICFDSVFPGLVREFVVEGAELLVVITNDGWFGRTSGPYQHAEAAVFRAIENRRSVVRCANTGVSTLIDAYGRKSQTTGIFHQAVLNGRVAPERGVTFYTRYGDLFSQVCTVLAVMILAVASIRRPGEEPERTILPQGAAKRVPAEREEEDSELAEGGQPMPFLDHLEELRWHILKGLAAVGVGAICCGIFSDEILNALTRPIRQMESGIQLITLKPIGMFVVKLQIALVGGVVLALPVLLYQLWIFVAPGLYLQERKYVTFIILSFMACFAVGASAAYFGVVPVALIFLVGLTSGTDIVAQFDIGMYISFVLRLVVAFGVVFELPVATFFLAKVGLLTGDRMRAGRRYAILIGFVLAALLTPPDPISQMMMAVPLIVLYEVSIWVAMTVNR